MSGLIDLEQQGAVDVNGLAQIIREVDGDHSLGASVLAEAILSRAPNISTYQSMTDERNAASGCWRNDWYARREEHAREMGYAGLADALDDLQTRRDAVAISARQPVGQRYRFVDGSAGGLMIEDAEGEWVRYAAPPAQVDLLRRALPFLHDEGGKYEDDGSNEPLELAREIEALIDQQSGKGVR